MTQIKARKVILKNKQGGYLIPYTLPYTAGNGIKITNNIISTDIKVSDFYTKEEIDNLLKNITENNKSSNISYSVDDKNKLLIISDDNQARYVVDDKNKLLIIKGSGDDKEA